MFGSICSGGKTQIIIIRSDKGDILVRVYFAVGDNRWDACTECFFGHICYRR